MPGWQGNGRGESAARYSVANRRNRISSKDAYMAQTIVTNGLTPAQLKYRRLVFSLGFIRTRPVVCFIIGTSAGLMNAR